LDYRINDGREPKEFWRGRIAWLEKLALAGDTSHTFASSSSIQLQYRHVD